MKSNSTCSTCSISNCSNRTRSIWIHSIINYTATAYVHNTCSICIHTTQRQHTSTATKHAASATYLYTALFTTATATHSIHVQCTYYTCSISNYTATATRSIYIHSISNYSNSNPQHLHTQHHQLYSSRNTQHLQYIRPFDAFIKRPPSPILLLHCTVKCTVQFIAGVSTERK